jgi:5-(carboxyamino)imidazole ribonucleotide mutase
MVKIGVVIGSKSDTDMIQPTLSILDQLGIGYELSVVSAHRSPEKIRNYGLGAEEKGFELIIAAAGGAAHLPGVLASWTSVPVIGIPVSNGALHGIDALLSIVQMPGGVPVACVGIGKGGATNAALLAAQILGMKYDDIKQAYKQYKMDLAGNK